MKYKRQSFIAGLRAVADFLEQHPELHTPSRSYTVQVQCHNSETLAEQAKALGSCKKVSNYTQIGLKKEFGMVKLQINWPKYVTCKRVLVKGEIETEGTWVWGGNVTRPKYKWVCPTSFINACCEEK